MGFRGCGNYALTATVAEKAKPSQRKTEAAKYLVLSGKNQNSPGYYFQKYVATGQNLCYNTEKERQVDKMAVYNDYNIFSLIKSKAVLSVG